MEHQNQTKLATHQRQWPFKYPAALRLFSLLANQSFLFLLPSDLMPVTLQIRTSAVKWVFDSLSCPISNINWMIARNCDNSSASNCSSRSLLLLHPQILHTDKGKWQQSWCICRRLGITCAYFFLPKTRHSAKHHQSPASEHSRRDGQAVFPELRSSGDSRKLSLHFIRPFPIVKMINSLTAIRKVLGSLNIYPSSHFSLFKPVASSCTIFNWFVAICFV